MSFEIGNWINWVSRCAENGIGHCGRDNRDFASSGNSRRGGGRGGEERIGIKTRHTMCAASKMPLDFAVSGLQRGTRLVPLHRGAELL